MSQNFTEPKALQVITNFDGQGFDYYIFDVEPDGMIPPFLDDDGCLTYIQKPRYFLLDNRILFGVPFWDLGKKEEEQKNNSE